MAQARVVRSVIEDAPLTPDAFFDDIPTTMLPEKVPLVIDAEDRIKAILQARLQKRSRYHILTVEPDPNVDYKIIRVQPDPSVDYKIIVINPDTNETDIKLSEEFQEIIPKMLRIPYDNAK